MNFFKFATTLFLVALYVFAVTAEAARSPHAAKPPKSDGATTPRDGKPPKSDGAKPPRTAKPAKAAGTKP